MVNYKSATTKDGRKTTLFEIVKWDAKGSTKSPAIDVAEVILLPYRNDNQRVITGAFQAFNTALDAFRSTIGREPKSVAELGLALWKTVKAGGSLVEYRLGFEEPKPRPIASCLTSQQRRALEQALADAQLRIPTSFKLPTSCSHDLSKVKAQLDHECDAFAVQVEWAKSLRSLDGDRGLSPIGAVYFTSGKLHFVLSVGMQPWDTFAGSSSRGAWDNALRFVQGLGWKQSHRDYMRVVADCLQVYVWRGQMRPNGSTRVMAALRFVRPGQEL